MENCAQVKGLFCIKECNHCIDCETLKRFKKAVSQCYATDMPCINKYDCNHCDARDLLQNLIDYKE